MKGHSTKAHRISGQRKRWDGWSAGRHCAVASRNHCTWFVYHWCSAKWGGHDQILFSDSCNIAKSNAESLHLYWICWWLVEVWRRFCWLGLKIQGHADTIIATYTIQPIIFCLLSDFACLFSNLTFFSSCTGIHFLRSRSAFLLSHSFFVCRDICKYVRNHRAAIWRQDLQITPRIRLDNSYLT